MIIPMPGPRSILMKTAVAGCGLLAGLAIAELACKVYDIRASEARRQLVRKISRVSDIPGVRYELVPGVTSVTPQSEALVRVNNLGFRGPDVELQKPAGRFRIVIMGDSIAFGRTYHEEEIFPTLLQRRLAADHPDRRIEVINAALSGRDTWETRAVFEHRVLPLSPDVVILQICLNDHIRLPSPSPDERHGAFGERSPYAYSSLLSLVDKRLPGFRAFHVRTLQRIGIDHRSPEQKLRDSVISPRQMLDVEPRWEAWSREIMALCQGARSAGAEPLLIVFPLDSQLADGSTDTLPLLSELTALHRIHLLDMIHFFDGDPDRYLRDYTHPSREGHRTVAAELARVIGHGLE